MRRDAGGSGASGRDNDRWFRPAAQQAHPVLTHGIAAGEPGWAHTGLLVATGGPQGSTLGGPCEDVEIVVVPLQGGCTVTWRVGDHDETLTLAGRPSVWAGPTDVAYLPAAPGAAYDVRLPEGSRVAVCTAATRTEGARLGPACAPRPRHVRADEVEVELRGAGVCSREVRNLATPSVLPEARRVIACEVLTPAGNWSSYPPHKHDEERPGEEAELEEIYYFEARTTPGVAAFAAGEGDPVGYHRVYGTPQRPIDVVAEVRTGDVVLVPHGWHGPSVAAPDADLYYLNVMAGPGEQRAWLICDDPRHGAIRSTWRDQPVDPRLPFGGPRPPG